MKVSMFAVLLSWPLPFLAAAPVEAQAMPELILDGDVPMAVGVPVVLPLTFLSSGQDITAIAFSLDLDTQTFELDPSDGDGDGVPDAVTFPFGSAGITAVSFDAGDEDGELDVLLAELSGLPIPDGLLMEIELLPATAGTAASWIRFSPDPAPSFGDAQGQDVPGTAVVTGSDLFADGFESGDLSGGWSATGRAPRRSAAATSGPS